MCYKCSLIILKIQIVIEVVLKRRLYAYNIKKRAAMWHRCSKGGNENVAVFKLSMFPVITFYTT